MLRKNKLNLNQISKDQLIAKLTLIKIQVIAFIPNPYN